MVSARDVAGVVRSSSLAVLAWVGRDGRPHATGALALTRGAVPVVALPFARSRLARTLEGDGPTGRVGPLALALVEERGTGPGFRRLSITGDLHLVEDTTGELYVDELVVEELRRYPPARLLADSPLLMREHWWWLPRLVVEVREADVAWLEEERPEPGRRQVLVTVASAAPRVTPVETAPGPGSPHRLLVNTRGGPPPAEGPAVVFDQDASFPDLERWAEWCWRGELRSPDPGELILDVVDAPTSTGLPPAPRLLERWRAHRRLERACRRGLAAWETRS